MKTLPSTSHHRQAYAADVSSEQAITLRVQVSGNGSFTYQWRKDGTNLSDGGVISGATSTNLLITSASSSDAGLYDLVVTNVCGSVTSARSESGSAGVHDRPITDVSYTGGDFSLSFDTENGVNSPHRAK